MSKQQTIRLTVYTGMDGIGIYLASTLIDWCDTSIITSLFVSYNMYLYLVVCMGGITITDSIIAFGKLVEKVDNKLLQLPMRDTISIELGDRSLLINSFHKLNNSPIQQSFL